MSSPVVGPLANILASALCLPDGSSVNLNLTAEETGAYGPLRCTCTPRSQCQACATWREGALPPLVPAPEAPVRCRGCGRAFVPDRWAQRAARTCSPACDTLVVDAEWTRVYGPVVCPCGTVIAVATMPQRARNAYIVRRLAFCSPTCRRRHHRHEAARRAATPERDPA